MSQPERAVAVELTIAAPFATVWRALRDRDEIRRWHGWEYDGGLDAEIDVIYFQGVEADESAGTITIGDGSRFELEPRGDAETLVRITMPAPAGGASWDDFYDDIREGWTSFLHQLRYALEQHPGEDRRAFAVPARPFDPAGLPEETGARYAATTAWGEELTGTVLFRSAHQVGLTVDGYGPGLVIVHAKPDGGRLAIVTSYGDAAPEERWAAGTAPPQ